MTRAQRKQIIISAALLGALVNAGCAGMIKSLSGLNLIRNQLIEKYHEEVAINLANGRFLSIVFINSSLNKMGPGERSERAKETAQLVSRNYESIKSIEEIWVSFVATETHFIFFHKSEGLGGFGFDNNGRPLAVNPTDGENPLAPVVHFNQSRNETEVGLTRIQLAGDLNEGLALVPHFAVQGDARRTPSAPPERVMFDFASYARQPVFARNPYMEIYCDDRLMVKGPVLLLPSGNSSANEAIGQFLKVEITFKSFQKMAAARHVKISLDAKTFDLGPGDINALAAMAAYTAAAPMDANGR